MEKARRGVPQRAKVPMGLSGVEPLTSRLSGVRSNHLSYRPCRSHSQSRRGPFRGRNSSSSSSSNSSSRSSYSSRSSRSSSSSSSSSRSLSSSKSPNSSSTLSPRRLSDQFDVSRDNIVTPS